MATPALSTGQDTSKAPQAPTTATSTGPAPSLVRRSSFEPMRLGLGSLPPPVFSRAPSGQRSVPAIEFLNQDSAPIGQNPSTATANLGIVPSIGNASTGPPTGLASGTATPSVGLGNGSMTTEPWNLWSDSTAPHNGANPSSVTTTITPEAQNVYSTLAQEVNQATLQASSNAREDNELASALAAAVVLDKNHDKRSSITSRVSSSSRSNTGNVSGGGLATGDNTDTVADANLAASWPEGLTANPTAALQPQSFALDHNASPERRAGGDLSTGRQSASLIPRNVSFSSMLDLPQPDQMRDSSPPDGKASAGLDRKGSLTRRVSSNSQATLSTHSSSNTYQTPPVTSNNDSLSLPSLGFSSVPSAGAGSSYTSPPSSYGSTLKQSGNNSPTQSKTGLNYGLGAGGGRAGLGIDEYGIRFRQGTNASSTGGNSDYSSTASIAFGSVNNNNDNNNNSNTRGIGGFTNDGYSNDQNNGFGGGFNPRRDSGYGLSIYNSSPSVGFGGYVGDDRRGSRSASWQSSGHLNPSMNRNMSQYSYSPPPLSNPYNSPFGLPSLDGGNSFMSLNSVSSGSNNTSSSSSLLRYPSLNGGVGIGNGNLDYLLNTPSLQTYGLGFATPPPPQSLQSNSPYIRFPNSLPSLGSGGYGMNNDYERPRMFEEKNRPVRSPLLEEFRADKLKRWGVRDMHGHIAEFMCDQVGSRYIQESILEHPTSQDCDLIFEEIHHLILNLSIDVFANFCVQKLLEKASEEQIAILAENIKGNVLRLSLQTYGCRVIQKTLEVVSPEHQIMILRELEGTVQKCVRDQNANHVIQKIVTTCPPDLLNFVVDAFIGNVYTFATHPYSCRVLQRILENCPERMTRPILEELKSYALNLMQDQYGNYVIQFCLERGLPHDKADIICQIHGQVLHFSKHKFASNVVEKCIINASDHEINMIAAEVLAPGLDGNTGIQAMLRHEFANYPLQRLIKHTTGPVHLAIVEQVSMQLAIFRESNPPFNAKHLVAVEKLLVDLSPAEFPGLIRRRYEDHYINRAR